jgi:hypothetical protein
MREFDQVSDADLKVRMDAARKAAHDAPRDSQSSAWARHSREYFKLLEEYERRRAIKK